MISKKALLLFISFFLVLFIGTGIFNVYAQDAEVQNGLKELDAQFSKIENRYIVGERYSELEEVSKDVYYYPSTVKMAESDGGLGLGIVDMQSNVLSSKNLYVMRVIFSGAIEKSSVTNSTVILIKRGEEYLTKAGERIFLKDVVEDMQIQNSVESEKTPRFKTDQKTKIGFGFLREAQSSSYKLFEKFMQSANSGDEEKMNKFSIVTGIVEEVLEKSPKPVVKPIKKPVVQDVKQVEKKIVEDKPISQEIEEEYIKADHVIVTDNELILVFGLDKIGYVDEVQIAGVKSLKADIELSINLHVSKLKGEFGFLGWKKTFGGTNAFTSKVNKYTFDQKVRELEMLKQKQELLDRRKEFVVDYYLSDTYKNYFEFVNQDVYFFDWKLLRKEGDKETVSRNTVKNQDFYITDHAITEIDEKNLYMLDVNFSRPITKSRLKKDAVLLEDRQGVRYKPEVMFVAEKEMILVFRAKKAMEAHLLYLDSVFGNKLVNGEEEIAELEGFYSLLQDSDRYIQLTSEVNNEYMAIVSDDIIFDTEKISFGKFHNELSTDSTIALRMAGASDLDKDCRVLIFGEDLKHTKSSGAIPSSGLTLLTKVKNGKPISESVITLMEVEKKKRFLGSLEFSELEKAGNDYILYLNLTAPKGLTTGKYEAQMSVDLYCPKN